MSDPRWDSPNYRLHHGLHVYSKTVAGVYIAGTVRATAKNQMVAYKRYRENVAAYERGERQRYTKTVEQYLTEWLEGVKLTRSIETYRSYEKQCRTKIYPVLGKIKLRDLRAEQIQNLLYALGREQIGSDNRYRSSTSVNEVRKTLSVALNAAERLGIISYNPTRRTEPLRRDTAAVTPLSADELARFLAEARKHRLYPLFLLTVATGMRRGEIIGVRWEDVDFTRSTLKLYPSKTGLPHELYIPQSVINSLEACRRPSGLVFTNAGGAKLHGNHIYNVTVRLMEKAGITPVRHFHALRHTCASLLAANGVSIYEVQRLLGHASPTITANIYTHLFPSQERHAAETMGTILGTMLDAPENP